MCGEVCTGLFGSGVFFDPDQRNSSAGLFEIRAAPSSLVLCIAVAILLWNVAPCWAQSRASIREMQFDIPEQPLDAALEAYIQVTGLQVLYQSALVMSRSSTAVRGQFTSEKAIERLLAGTNLVARYTAEGAFTIGPPASAQDDAPIGRKIVDYDLFLGRAQQRIVASLCRNAITRPGNYRAVLQFSIGPAGLVDGALLLGSTGDEARDRLVPNLLRGMAIGQAPPPAMPQPVTMLIAPRGAEFADECQRYSR
jgi:hypothetical protein